MTEPFRMATVDGPQIVDGARGLNLKVGERSHRFALHPDGTLSDWRSGYRFGNIDSDVRLLYRARLRQHAMSDRTAAQTLVTRKLQAYGLTRLEMILSKPPTLNPL